MMFYVIFIFEIIILCLICRCQAYLLALAVRAACSPERLLEWYLASPKLVAFGLATVFALVEWMLDQSHTAQYVK